MYEVFRPYLRKFVLVFFDDILIYCKDLSQYKSHLSKVFQLLLDNTIFVKLNKCIFAVDLLEYVGHIISSKGVCDPKKAQAMQDWLIPPTSIKQPQGFLGMVGCYWRFIKNYANLSQPLYFLSRGNKVFHQNEAAQQAFNSLKQSLITAPVLALPNYKQDFIIETNASSSGIGAVLLQNGHPIAYISKMLSPEHQALPAYEKEMFPVFFAIKRKMGPVSDRTALCN